MGILTCKHGTLWWQTCAGCLPSTAAKAQAEPTPLISPAMSKEDTVEAIGSPDDFWYWSEELGYDLTRPDDPDTAPFSTGIRLEADFAHVNIEPKKTALLIIDMQNYSLHRGLKLPHVPEYYEAEKSIIDKAIPAARKAGIQVIWLNWGLTEEEFKALPPSILRSFGFDLRPQASLLTSDAKPRLQGEVPRYGGIGTELGKVVLATGSEVDAGRALIRDTWNAAIHEPMLPSFEAGLKAARPDILIHKNRNSGLWNDNSDLNEYLAREGIRTLLFTGMNVDQCVLHTLFDAQARSFDAILLRDGCATDTPDYALKTVEYNCQRPLGFLSSCSALMAAAGLQNDTALV